MLHVVALPQWLSRSADGGAAQAPRWMGALDRVTPAKAAGAGVALTAANPKNLLLAVCRGCLVIGAKLIGDGISGLS